MIRFSLAALRLTVFYVAIVMVMSACVSLFFYRLATQELNNHLEYDQALLNNISRTELSEQDKINLERSMETQIELSEGKILTDLFYLNGLVFFLSTLVSYYLANRTIRPLEELYEIQKRFATDASHELRTPLTAMKTEIEVNLRDKNLRVDDLKKLLQSNLEEIEKLEQLSNGLMTLARLQEDPTLEVEVIYLKDKIIRAYEQVKILAEKKNISIKLKLKNVTVMGNSESMVKLFVILLDNAIKYSPEGSKIEVISTISGKNVEIEVKDQGIGISKTDIPYIFLPFYRSEQSRCRTLAKGDGIGLSIAKKIVDVHGGGIEVKSELGSGASFIVRLPFYNRRKHSRPSS